MPITSPEQRKTLEEETEYYFDQSESSEKGDCFTGQRYNVVVTNDGATLYPEPDGGVDVADAVRVASILGLILSPPSLSEEEVEALENGADALELVGEDRGAAEACERDANTLRSILNRLGGGKSA